MIIKTFQMAVSDDVINKVTALEHIATSCKCQIIVSNGKHQICADSVFGLLMLWSDTREQTITVSADGADEHEVMEKITAMFNSA